MTLFPYKKIKFLVPCKTEDFCTYIREIDHYTVTIENNTIILDPGGFLTHLVDIVTNLGFVGEFYAEGDSTRVILKPKPLGFRKFVDYIISILFFFAFFVFFINSISAHDIYCILILPIPYSILYMVRFVSNYSQIREIRIFLNKKIAENSDGSSS